MKIKANLVCKPSHFKMDDCQIEKVAELSREEFRRLTATPLEDQPFIEDHAALLNARVAEIAPAPEGTEVALTGVASQELARFSEACDAFLEAEQAMGPMI